MPTRLVVAGRRAPKALTPLTDRFGRPVGRPTGRRPSPPEAGGRVWRSRKPPKIARCRSLGEGPFFWVLFFGPAKKSTSGATAHETLLACEQGAARKDE